MTDTTIACPQGFFQDSSVSPEVIADLQSVIATAEAAGAAISASTVAAAASATAAAASAATAGGSQSAAATSATAAAASASTATSGASTATSQATAAASSSTSAGTFASNAASSASTAATSVTNATTQATAAANSATAAATSATSAAGSATSATTSAAQAATSALLVAGMAPLASPTFTGLVTVPNLQGGQLAGFRNALINGAMDFWQRGATPNFFNNTVASGVYSADRWAQSFDGSGSVTSVTTIRSGLPQSLMDLGFTMAYSTTVSTAGTGGTFRYVIQPIEDVRTLSGRQVTLSFWAKADASRTITAQLSQNFGTGGSPSSQVNNVSSSLSLTTSWQKFTYTVTLGTIFGKTLGTNGDSKLYVLFNLPLNTLMSFYVTGVQLEQGSVATPFEWRPATTELNLCQRYYQVVEGFQWTGTATASGVNAATPLVFPTKMRATPTVTIGTVAYGNASTLTVTGQSTSAASATLTAAAAGPYYGTGTASFSAEL